MKVIEQLELVRAQEKAKAPGEPALELNGQDVAVVRMPNGEKRLFMRYDTLISHVRAILAAQATEGSGS